MCYALWRDLCDLAHDPPCRRPQEDRQEGGQDSDQCKSEQIRSRVRSGGSEARGKRIGRRKVSMAAQNQILPAGIGDVCEEDRRGVGVSVGTVMNYIAAGVSS